MKERLVNWRRKRRAKRVEQMIWLFGLSEAIRKATEWGWVKRSYTTQDGDVEIHLH